MCSAYTEHTQSMCGAQRLKVQSLQGLKGLQGPRCSLSRDTERGEETGPRVRGETARCESFGASYELDPHLHPYLHPHLRPQGALKCEVRVLLLQRMCGAQPLQVRHQRPWRQLLTAANGHIGDVHTRRAGSARAARIAVQALCSAAPPGSSKRT